MRLTAIRIGQAKALLLGPLTVEPPFRERGIGQALTWELARRGARVALIARRKEPLAELARQVQTAGGVAEYRAVDVTRIPHFLPPNIAIAPVVPPRPMVLFRQADFWTQGLNFGMELKF